MSTIFTQSVDEYFFQRTKKVYIEQCTKIVSFEEYLKQNYSEECYYYSAYALMGLKPSDFLVRGYINITSFYHHGWVEFEFQGKDYVFDSRLENIVLKQKYYEKYSPRITYKKTQKEILDEYLNEKYAFEIIKGFWQFKYFIVDYDTATIPPLEVMLDYDEKNGYIPSSLMLARVVVNKYNSEIQRFIGYSEPSC